jgi:hypothetical protein
MAKPINLKTLTEEERGVLVEAIPVLRASTKDGKYWWEEPEFKRHYKKWLAVTKGEFAEGGFEQFRLSIARMRDTMPNTYKRTTSTRMMERWK